MESIIVLSFIGVLAVGFYIFDNTKAGKKFFDANE